MMCTRHSCWALAATLWATGCGDDSAGGQDLAKLQTSVADPAGHRTNAYCTVLPVLLGGRVRAEIDVDGEFSMLIEGDKDLVLLSFEGVRDAADLELAIDAERLRSGYSETFEITTSKDRRFIVELASGCDP
jgi:hypothetical protein